MGEGRSEMMAFLSWSFWSRKRDESSLRYFETPIFNTLQLTHQPLPYHRPHPPPSVILKSSGNLFTRSQVAMNLFEIKRRRSESVSSPLMYNNKSEEEEYFFRYFCRWCTNSVTRFAKISPLCLSFKSLWLLFQKIFAFGKILNLLWQTSFYL